MKQKWTKVKNLQVGARIAVHDNDGSLDWDEIVSIKSVGRERVYDIEVENAHNFVAGHLIDSQTGGALSPEAEGKTLSEIKHSMPDIFVDKRFFFGGILAHNTYIFGNVGVGIATSTPPSHALEVAGDIAAEAFVNISTREAKKDIQYLADSDYRLALAKIASTSVAVYDYNDEADCPRTTDYGLQPDTNFGGSPSAVVCSRRLGLIAEEAPREVLSADGKGVDLYKMTSLVFAGVKELNSEVQDVKLQVADLEKAVEGLKLQGDTARVALASDLKQSLQTILGEQANLDQGAIRSLADGLIGSVLNAFRSLGVAFENGWMKVSNLFAANLETRKVTVNIAPDDQTNPNIPPRDPTIGTGQINVGEKDVYILNNQVSTTSKIFITPVEPVALGVCELQGLPLRDSVARATLASALPGFRVCLAEPAKEIMRFNWWIIGTNSAEQEKQGQPLQGSPQGSPLSPSPEVSETPAPSETPETPTLAETPAASPEASVSPEVSTTPTPSATPAPSETPAETPSPSPEATPAPSETPETPTLAETPAASPEASVSPEVSTTPSATPAPSAN